MDLINGTIKIQTNSTTGEEIHEEEPPAVDTGVEVGAEAAASVEDGAGDADKCPWPRRSYTPSKPTRTAFNCYRHF